MGQSDFYDALKGLREAIKELDQVPEKDQDLLICLSRDIENFLGRPHEEMMGALKEADFFERLEEAIIHLQQAHPRLAAVIEQVMNALSDMGI